MEPGFGEIGRTNEGEDRTWNEFVCGTVQFRKEEYAKEANLV